MMRETNNGAYCAMESETCTADAVPLVPAKPTRNPEADAQHAGFWEFAEQCRKRVEAWPLWKKRAVEEASYIPYWDSQRDCWYWPERRKVPWLQE